MLGITFGIVESNVDNLTIGIALGNVNGIDKSFVGSKVEGFVTIQYLFVESGINFYSIFLNQLTTGFKVTFALDALYLGDAQ